MRYLLFLGLVLGISGLATPSDKRSSWPARCHQTVKNQTGSTVTDQQAIKLCRGAKSLAPATCFWEARSYTGSTLTNEEAIELCRPVLCQCS